MAGDRVSDVLDPRPTGVRPVPLCALATELGADVHGQVDAEATVTGLTLASGAVRPGDLYAALPGARTHGARYAAAAAAAGAVAVLTDASGVPLSGDAGLPVLELPDPRARLGDLARTIYADAAAGLTTTGITGTQGKTTVAYLLEAGLSGAGARPAVIGTTGTRIRGRHVASALTTPEAPDLHALFAVMAEQGADACAMEVSSHALVQGRVDGIVFDVAVFLNLGRDHLDFHGDIETYFAAKATLFTPQRARAAVINVDDEHGRRLAASTTLPVTTWSIEERQADWRASDIASVRGGSRFTLRAPNGTAYSAAVAMPGRFNVSNATGAIAALANGGWPVRDVVDAVAAVNGVPGRMERIDVGQPFQVVVDYAHKPDALEAVLVALREGTVGRVIAVLGAGGDRDPGKRTLMGEVVARLADLVFITDDNPRTEDPTSIRAALLAGARTVGPPDALVEVADRRSAIDHALRAARAGDCVLVAGKGHEKGQEVDGVVHPFDDRDVVRELLARPGVPQ